MTTTAPTARALALSARSVLDEYYEKSERDTFEPVDGMEWAEHLAVELEVLLDAIQKEAA